jgi:hypothetical protein
VLLSPSPYDVARYVKGSGPSRIMTEAGTRRDSDGRQFITSIDVRPRPGEPWRLYGEFDEQGQLATDLCRGSRPMASAYAQACPSSVPEDGFSDVPAHHLHEPAIDCATWRGLTLGAGGDRYAPAGTATRDAFTDDEHSVHERAINQLAALGVLHGTSANRFSPDAPVSRAQAAALLVRAHEQDSGEPLPVTRDHFSDDEDSRHEVEINKATDARFFGATGYQQFSPDAAVTRSQVASAAVRWIDLRLAR